MLAKDHKVCMSSYHGGDMEGPPARRLMACGPTAFADIANYIKQTLNNDQNDDGNENNEDMLVALNDEIDSICKDHGEVFALLLDVVFSLLNTPRGKVDDYILDERGEQLAGLPMEWYRVKLSFTPKLHILLNHSIEQLRRTGGFSR
jgi:hypothetical protein